MPNTVTRRALDFEGDQRSRREGNLPTPPTFKPKGATRVQFEHMFAELSRDFDEMVQRPRRGLDRMEHIYRTFGAFLDAVFDLADKVDELEAELTKLKGEGG